MTARSSDSSRERSDAFLRDSRQFQLGALTTEASHHLTTHLAEVARGDISAGLGLLFDADGDVVEKYREFMLEGRADGIADEMAQVVRRGGRLFFTGCGATGRLSIQLTSIWRNFWREQHARGLACLPSATALEARVCSVMAGGDYALIRSVEGFEDFTAFGRKQLHDLGVTTGDMVFAITEGGETSFVIGTAWQGLDSGAKVIFVYNNPDEVLRQHVSRSREILDEPRIEKLNLTTGPMAITGSTRMQATSIQLCVLVTLLEMAVRKLMNELEPGGQYALHPGAVPGEFLRGLEAIHQELRSESIRSQLAKLVALEEGAYRSRGRTNYFASRFGLDVLTDTTERSPTYCTPPFRKHGDTEAAESWAWLFLPEASTPDAWESILKRPPECLQWSEDDVRPLMGDGVVGRTCQVLAQITRSELMRFRIGQDGLSARPSRSGDSATVVLAGEELSSLSVAGGFYRKQLEAARESGAGLGMICLGGAGALEHAQRFLEGWGVPCNAVLVPVPETGLVLDGVRRVGLKMLLNALSTCIMVRLGRVMGNFMIWVVPSNLKLIDRATRYIQKLARLEYPEANRLLFEVLEYVEPRMRADQSYPPAVGVAVIRARLGLGNEEAEKRLMAEMR